MVKFGVNQSVERKEDFRLITGSGEYTDDITLDGQLYGYMLRSPVAHAKILSIDVDDARAAPGVVDIILGTELEADKANQLPCMIPLKNRDGSDRSDPGHAVLATDKVRYAGDNIAYIVAESLAQAKDAAELIMFDFDELDVVVDTKTANEDGQPLVHDSVANNVAFDWAQGDEKNINDVMANAAHVTEIDLINNRVVVNSMEPRGLIADWDTTEEKMTVRMGTQGGWVLRSLLANSILHVPEEKVRVITPDVGGAFGMKLFFYSECAATVWASRKLGRPIKWMGERSDAFLSDTQGRDHVTHAKLAFDADQKITGMMVETNANLGAYFSTFGPLIPTMAAVKVMPGVYDIPDFYYHCTGVFTNTVPVDAYRGAGRPEAIYIIERLMDKAAREFGIGQDEIRRKNFIPVAAIPYKTATGCVYDSGEFERIMDRALETSGWSDFSARKAKSAENGKRRGIGMCYFIEATAGNPTENATIRFEDENRVTLAVGTQSSGQGHSTAYAQIVAERLGVPFENIDVIQGDTDKIKTGGGTGGSRSLTTQGPAIHAASDEVINKGKELAGHFLETAAVDIEFSAEEGEFAVAGTDRKIGILELAHRARGLGQLPENLAEGLNAEASFTVEAFTYPNGCHIAEVEIDELTGATDVVRYVIVDDFGTIVNPALVRNQVIGGVGQGIGQALTEHTVYSDDGQLLTGSFMDYGMPRADHVPVDLLYETIEVPCTMNPMGVKGCGEAGCIAAPPAVINGIIDALQDIGVRHIDMPATPQKVWNAIQMAS
ncbi:xanthine dehydrogenase family protein molybdopterin-binding subunit [uncultured Sneathiella sp.]|jgi:carbon-monoxide dehydrogenase large subunit|uniref:xanthine dehydrogenase family protein molybdopterin-binding subunit n=1 Tax=uncultured Sneathiella sp. TaxID=879315 RepID=UPI0030DCA3CD|tara:strand:- start:2023 stop:4353 length:2331 start_codon:yes stop_codon:yes gene_type:complete